MENEEKTRAAGKLLKKISRKAGVTMRDHSMLEAGDHILIGVSGGKDSMILMEVLADRRASLPFDIAITAAHIHLRNVGYQINRDYMEKFSNDLNIPIIFREDEIRDKTEKGICYNCSRLRRKMLFDIAFSNNCNKLALGHHRYDALETLLMNMIYHGSISSLPQNLKMFDDKLELIRPFIDINEKMLIEYAALKEYKVEEKNCSYELQNKREKIRNLIYSIEAIHGKGSYNMFKSMRKIFPDYLPK